MMQNSINSKQQKDEASWFIWFIRLLLTLLALGSVVLIYLSDISSHIASSGQYPTVLFTPSSSLESAVTYIHNSYLLSSAYTWWILLGAALIVPLFSATLRRHSFLFIHYGVVLVAIVLLTVLTSPFTPSPSPTAPSADTFALPVSKINSDLSVLTSRDVVVVLVANNQEYRYDAQIFQESQIGTPTPCLFSTPMSTPATSSSLTSIPMSCLNDEINIVSVTLHDSSQSDNFITQLATASAIYVLPASNTPVPTAASTPAPTPTATATGTPTPTATK